MNCLVGKFVYAAVDDAYRTGEIVASVDDHFYLVQFDILTQETPAVPNMGATLVCLHEMSADDDETWSFFNTREELQNFINWLDASAEPEVVKLVPKSKPSKARH